MPERQLSQSGGWHMLGFAMCLGLAMSVSQPAAATPEYPVLFVHGFRSSANTWADFGEVLQDAGWTFGGLPELNEDTLQIDNVDPGHFYLMNFSDKDDSPYPSQRLYMVRRGYELGLVVHAILQANPDATKVAVVGHSLGGLAARAYLQGLAAVFPGGPTLPYGGDVATLITVATPHAGAQPANFCIDVAACQALGINPESISLSELNPTSGAMSILNDLVSDPLPSLVIYDSLIGIGYTVIGTSEDGDGFVTVTSQNLGNVMGAAGLDHTAESMWVAERPECDLFGLDQSHTCETTDAGVMAEVLQRLNALIAPPAPAPSVTTQEASLVGASSAVLNMTVNPNGSATDAWFLWDDDSLVDLFTTPSQAVGAGTSAVPIAYGLSALDCETTYFFRGIAENQTDQTAGSVRSFTTGSCGAGGPGGMLENGGFEDGPAHWTTAADFHIGQASWPRSGSWYAFVATDSWEPGNSLSGVLKSDPIAFPGGTTAARLSFFYSITTDETTSSSERDKLHIWIQDDSGGVLHTYDPLSNLDETPSPGTYQYWSEALPQSVLSDDVQITFVGQTNSSLPTVFRIDDVELEATVSPGGSPDVTTDPADEITVDSARLNLTVSSNGASTDVWFEWDDDPNLSYETDDVAVGADAEGLAVSVELADLDCSETYYFRAFGENVHGQDSGSQRSFTTASCPGGPPSADTDPVASITHTGAELRGDILPNGLPTTAYYEWGTDAGLGNATPAQSVGSGDVWVDFPQTLSGLDCGTEYFFRAHAENGAGSDDGLTYSFTTLTCFPDNQAPLTGIDSFYTPLDQALSVPAPGVLGNDSDPEDDPITAHLVDPATLGQVTLYPNGSFSYTPPPGLDGSDTFTYVANDGLLDSAVTTVTILIGTPPSILWPDIIDLDTVPGTEPVPVTRIYGLLPQASFARHVTSGDFNADGFADLLVGAEDAEPLMRDEAGAAYVVWGSAALPNVTETKVDQGGITSIYGLVDDNLGSCVAAGDIDNDGFDDLVIGADRFENGTRSRAGKVVVVYGQASLPAVIDMEAALVEKTEILGPDSNHFMGRSCAVGDLNNDGFDDVLAGANTTDFGDVSDVGKHFVIFGSASLASVINLRDVSPDVELWGAGENDELGRELTAGDINDDGFDDLILSGSGTTNREHIYVLWGGSSLPSFRDLSLSLAGMTKILGPPQGSYGVEFGRPVTTGDVDNDGVEDLIAGAIGSEVLCPEDCGAVFVIFGTPALSGMSTLDVGVTPGTEATAVTRLHGVAQDSFLGASVSTGDFNNDGQTDLVAGVSGFGERETVYAIPGRPELRDFVDATIESEALQATRIRSPTAGVSMGIDSTVGDVNGDGFDDAIIGAHRVSTADGTNVGAAFIVYGGVRSLSSPYRTLTVDVVGNGTGTVWSTPAGMNCAGQCQADYLLGSDLDLDASADFGSVLDRWIGAGCSGTGTCSIVIEDHTSVAALFVEPDACGEADTLHLHGMSVETTEVFEACSHLSTGTGFRVEEAGNVTLRSGGGVSLHDGTSVLGRLEIESDAPDLIPP